MEHSTLMEVGNYFALCKNCDNVTVRDFSKCHKCLNSIDKKEYKQFSNMDKYNVLIKALMTFEIDTIEDCHSMVSIEIEGDKSSFPELHQIYKKNDEYTYAHLGENKHEILQKQIIDPKIFIPALSTDKKYQISLAYGPNVIYIYQ